MVPRSVGCAGVSLGFVALGLMFLPDHFIARAEQPAKPATVLGTMLEARLYARLKANHVLFREIPHHTLVVERVEGDKLRNLVILRKDDRGEIEAVTQAREGELRVHPKSNKIVLGLRNGVLFTKDGTGMYFDNRTMEFSPALKANTVEFSPAR